MTEDLFIHILDEIRHIHSAIEATRNDVREVMHRINSLDGQVAILHEEMGRIRADLTHLSARIDHLTETV
jgi:chromosome segregation ATPase